MTRRRRPRLALDAERRNQEQLARLGGDVRASRRRRRLTLAGLAERAGVGASTAGRVEHGRSGDISIDTLQRVALASGRPLRLELERDREEEPRDAAHLAIEELVMRVARAAGYRATFELPTRPADPSRSVDVGLRDDRRRLLVLGECWNRFGDVGAGARSSDRKRAEAERLAGVFGGEDPDEVRSCWIVRATPLNRALVARYPELFAASRAPRNSGYGHSPTAASRQRSPASSGPTWQRRASSRGAGEVHQRPSTRPRGRRAIRAVR